MSEPYYGPTVSEVADMKIINLALQEAEIQDEIRRWKKLRTKYSGSYMLYAEYVATKTEPFQTTQLPNRPDLADMDNVFPKENGSTDV